MKNTITLLFCLTLTTLVIVFRSEIYDSTRPLNQRVQDTQGNLSEQRPLTIHYHDRRPYYVNLNGEVHGLVADVISTALNYADIEFTWLQTPATRQLDIIRENASATCAAGWFKTKERQNFAQFTLPVYQDQPFVAITRRENDLIGSDESLERLFKEWRLRLLAKDGYSYGTYIDSQIQKFSPRQVMTTADNRTMMLMLQTHRADYCFMTEEEAYDLLLFSGLNKMNFRVINLKDVPHGNLRYLICSNLVPGETMERINGAIRHLLHFKEEKK